jgi:hypothetical protein
VPHLDSVVQAAAARFADQSAYNATVLSGPPGLHRVVLPAGSTAGISPAAVLTGVGSAAGGAVLALMALYWRRLPVLRRGFEPGTGLVRAIERVQSGVVNDYVTWIVVGVACVGGALAFGIR